MEKEILIADLRSFPCHVFLRSSGYIPLWSEVMTERMRFEVEIKKGQEGTSFKRVRELTRRAGEGCRWNGHSHSLANWLLSVPNVHSLPSLMLVLVPVHSLCRRWNVRWPMDELEWRQLTTEEMKALTHLFISHTSISLLFTPRSLLFLTSSRAHKQSKQT